MSRVFVVDTKLRPLHPCTPARARLLLKQQKAAVLSGYWPLLRYNPDLVKEGKNPFQLDSRPPSIPLEKYVHNESRYTMLAQSHPEAARALLKLAQQDVQARWRLYQHWASLSAAEVVKEVAR